MARARPQQAREEMSWSGWGDPDRAAELPAAFGALLRETLGLRGGAIAPASLDALELEPSRLPDGIHAELAAIVGDAHVHPDAGWRARHRGGKSTIDLLELRAGRRLSAPDAVLTPDVAGFSAAVALDVRRLDALVAVDDESRLAVLEPGLRGPEAEALLAPRGYTLGHFPQSYEYATLGGFAAARSSGQSSAGYGRFDDRVLALRLATPAGTLELGRAPKSAAGPDLRQLVLGSEGALGVITSLTLALHRAPERRVYEGWRLPDFGAGAAVLRRLAQDGPPATVLRLSDEAETALGLARPGTLASGEGGGGGGCLAILGWEGTAADVAGRRAATVELLRDAGGEPVPGAGDGWAEGRFRAPYLRDALLDAGALVETLETVTFWSGVPRLYAAVSEALRATLTGLGSPPVILCHISHVYASGASLYFTVACAQLADPVGQWRAAKAAAGEAILAAGGSITHHHGVGADHRELYAREIGPLGVEVLRAVKRTLDPAGILNPGILVPAGAS